MTNLKTSVQPFVLLFAAFEVQFELLDGQPQKHKKPYVLLLAAFEVQFELLDGRPQNHKKTICFIVCGVRGSARAFGWTASKS